MYLKLHLLELWMQLCESIKVTIPESWVSTKPTSKHCIWRHPKMKFENNTYTLGIQKGCRGHTPKKAIFGCRGLERYFPTDCIGCLIHLLLNDFFIKAAFSSMTKKQGKKCVNMYWTWLWFIIVSLNLRSTLKLEHTTSHKQKLC